MITASQIEEVFQDQLNEIENKEIRQKVIQTWLEGCRQGNWTSIEELHKLPFTLLTKTYGISLIEHTIAVTEGACALADAQENAYKQMPYKINMDRLIAGGLLHDVGKLIETEKDGKGGYRKSSRGMYARHPISGAILAAQVGLPDDIVNTIACHAKEGEGAPKVVETVLIHQADFATFDPLVMLDKGRLLE